MALLRTDPPISLPQEQVDKLMDDARRQFIISIDLKHRKPARRRHDQVRDRPIPQADLLNGWTISA
jgi:hypothetical protein